LPALSGGAVGKEFVRSRIRTYSAVRNERYRFTQEVKTGTPCELFDLETDPGELTNLVDEPRYASTIDALRKVVAQVVAEGDTLES